MAYYAPPGRGDYYRGGRGDLWGFLKGAGKAAVGYLTGGPVGAARSVVGSLSGGGGTPGISRQVSISPPAIGPVKLGPSISYSSHPTAAQVAAELGMPRRRRMNAANPKALRRALRRVQGFGALAARASADVAKANRALNRIPKKAPKRR